MRKYAAERGTEDVRSAVFNLGDLSVKVGETQFVSWRDRGDSLKQLRSNFEPEGEEDHLMG